MYLSPFQCIAAPPAWAPAPPRRSHGLHPRITNAVQSVPPVPSLVPSLCPSRLAGGHLEVRLAKSKAETHARPVLAYSRFALLRPVTASVTGCAPGCSCSATLQTRALEVSQVLWCPGAEGCAAVVLFGCVPPPPPPDPPPAGGGGK